MHLAVDSFVFKLEDLANRFSEWLNGRRILLLIVFSVVYFAVAIPWAHATTFWFDELFTYYISHQPTFQDQWAALRAIDDQPPLFFWVTTAASHLVADPQIGIRLPQICGFWLMSICLFLYTSRRTTALWGIVAVASVFLTPAFHYSHEARPYACVLGCAGLALICWQNAGRGIGRRLSLLGLALSLACAISFSYYAVLVVLPIAFAELTRSIWKRSVDWAVWAAVFCGAAVGVLYVPLVAKSVGRFAARNWASPHTTTVWEIYFNLAGTLFLMGMFVLFAAIAKRLWTKPEREHLEQGSKTEAPWEIVAALGFALLPFFGYVAAVLVTKMIHFRYVLTTVIGLTFLISWFFYRRTRSNALSAVVVAGLVSFAAIPAKILEYRNDAYTNRSGQSSLPQLLVNQPDRLPIVVDDPHAYLELFYYQKPETVSRIFFLLDDDASLRYGSLPYAETREWLSTRRFMPIRTEKLDLFRKRTKQYLLFYTGSRFGYLRPKLLADGAHLRLLAVQGDQDLYLVDDVLLGKTS